MDNNYDFITYLFISPKKIIISINKKKNFEQIYKKEKLFENVSNNLPYDKIDKFLNENILLIEKDLKSFIKKVNLIIQSKDFLPVQISLKQNDHDTLISHQNLNYLLNEAKNQCKDTTRGKKLFIC